MEKSNVELPTSVLKALGCKNCFWKSQSICPHGLVDDGELPEGYCTELGEFLFSLWEDGDTVSAIKEKFLIHMQQDECMADYKRYRDLLRQYEEKRSAGVEDKDMGELIIALQSSKVWWKQLSDSAVKAYGKISDRKSRSKDVQEAGKKISIQELNRLMRDARKIEDHSHEGDT